MAYYLVLLCDFLLLSCVMLSSRASRDSGISAPKTKSAEERSSGGREVVKIKDKAVAGDVTTPRKDIDSESLVFHDFYGDKFGSDIGEAEWGLVGGKHYQKRCVPIPSDMALCRNISYSEMRLPNELGHNSLYEVSEQAKSWVALVNVHCHADTRRFLCSIFAPICLEIIILPCRSLCLAVKAGCERKMMRYNFNWPEMLNCDRFPVDNDMCIGPLSSILQGT